MCDFTNLYVRIYIHNHKLHVQTLLYYCYHKLIDIILFGVTVYTIEEFVRLLTRWLDSAQFFHIKLFTISYIRPMGSDNKKICLFVTNVAYVMYIEGRRQLPGRGGVNYRELISDERTV